ncbi:protein patched homolog 1-like isoform X1 [Hydractinia symbiolongicarpus]|uniref:protein patched homolog 1-like isoform X1 n=3 Tax=Hydractinia symbiolongicarpus TaxID=13093 RepID=UPI00254E5012|nr:protein patched homolog 1-like isoform X1 [Hydractinia symbiolongicarpus]
MSPIDKNENEFVNIPLQDIKLNQNAHHTAESENNTTDGGSCLNCKKWDLFLKRTREKVHLMFYDLGCFIQKRYCMVAVISLLVVLPLAIGVKFIGTETDVEKMWIATGGRLQEEMEYTKKHIGSNGFGIEEFDYESFIQIQKSGKDNILDNKILLEHLDMLKKVLNLEITMYMQQWSLADFCIKYEVPLFKASQEEAKLIDSLRPCLIMTPLDCFWEGAYTTGTSAGKYSYLSTSPLELLDRITENSVIDVKAAKDFLHKAGVDAGYMNKTCLENTDISCPLHQWRGKILPEPDLGAILTGGCYRVAKKIMHWDEDLIISGIEKNSTGYIKYAAAFQTIIQVTNAEYFAKSEKAQSIPNFSMEKAKSIIDAWKLKFTELVNREGQRKKLRSRMIAFSTASFQDVIDRFTRINTKSVAVGFVIVTAYAIVSLKRWSSAVYSYSLMGAVGVAFVCVSVFSGIGISHFFGMKLSAASTQVLPYLAVGLGLDSMFLMVRTYVVICDSGQFVDTKIVGMCLGECGLSVTITSFANACAFLMASTIPILSLQEFSKQAAIIVLLNWFMLMFLFTSILSFDVERQKHNRIDLCCCVKNDEEEDEEDEEDDSRLYKDAKYNQKNLQNNMNKLFLVGTNPHVPTSNCPRNQRKMQEQSRRHFNVNQAEVKRRKKKESSRWRRVLKKFSVAYFVRNYFGKWMVSSQVKILVLFCCCIQLFLAGYGATMVKQELNIADMLPRNSPQHLFVTQRDKHFSYYAFHMITQYEQDGKVFDYANNQPLLHEYYKRISEVNNVLRRRGPDKYPRFWLIILRDWLIDCDKKFRQEWNAGRIHQSCVPNCNISREAKIVYLLLLLDHTDNEFLKKEPEKLVENGIIKPSSFYYALTLWYWNDHLGTVKAQASIHPPLKEPIIQNKQKLDERYKAEPQFISIPFHVHNLKTTEDFVTFVKDIRSICDEFAERGLPSYPKGIPFTYWEQFILLQKHMTTSGVVVLCFTFSFTLITVMSVRAAFIVAFFLTIIAFELYGFIGLLGINLSAIPVVVLIVSVGVAVEYTLHTVLAFVNTPGDRNERMRAALEITFAPKVDSAISILIVMALLSNSELDFVVKFFHLIICLVLTALFNGVFVLPVVLSFFGPCCEITHRSIIPSIQPAFTIPISVKVNINKNEKRRPAPNRHLTPIDEERSSEISSQESTTSVRPSTPYFSSSHGFSSSSDTSAGMDSVIPPEWEHTPRLYKNDTHSRRNNCRRNGTRHDFRTIPTNSCKKNRKTRSCTTSSNSALPSSQQSSRYSNRTKQNSANPRVIQVQSQDDNRSTTKVKATIQIEVEASTSSSYPSYEDDYDDDDGLPTINC